MKALAQWDQALDVALVREPWLCAMETRRLPIDTAPPGGFGDARYTGRFTCPKETLKVWSVDDGHRFAWQAASRKDQNGAVTRIIRANHNGPLIADLIMRRDPEALTPLLADALAWELAARLAGPIPSSEEKGRWASDKAATAYQLAAGNEASEIGGQDPAVEYGLTAARNAAP